MNPPAALDRATVPAAPPEWCPAPGYDPALPDEAPSTGSLSVVHGDPITLWSAPGSCTDLGAEVQLALQPEQSVVIGRQEGGEVPYLDPSYRSTPVMPDSGHTIMQGGGCERDRYVSRGHFTLRGNPLGIVLVNGV